MNPVSFIQNAIEDHQRMMRDVDEPEYKTATGLILSQELLDAFLKEVGPLKHMKFHGFPLAPQILGCHFRVSKKMPGLMCVAYPMTFHLKQ